MVFGFSTLIRPRTIWRDMTVGDRVFTVRIHWRRDARRMTMRVRDRAVRLSVPTGTSDSDIDKFVAEHSDWIAAQIKKEEDAVSVPVPGIEGPAIYHKGVPKAVRLLRDARHRGKGRIEEGPESLAIRVHTGSRVRPARVLEEWLREQARAAIDAELERVLPLLDEPPCPVTVRDQKTRWGSCSAARRLSFNWRLVMAPPECLSYVVVHEAAHLVHLDHSKAFWDLVAELMPDYRRHQRWLREHQAALFADTGERLAGLGAAGIANGETASAPIGEAAADHAIAEASPAKSGVEHGDGDGRAPRPLPQQPDLFR